MVTYGPSSDEKWSRIHIYKRVMVPWVMRNGPNMYLNIDTNHQSTDLSTRSIDHGRYRRSIRINLQRITVDRAWWIKIQDNFVVDLIDDTCGKFKCTTLKRKKLEPAPIICFRVGGSFSHNPETTFLLGPGGMHVERHAASAPRCRGAGDQRCV